MHDLLTARLGALLGSAEAAVADDLLRLGEWLSVPGGRPLFRQGDPAEDMYVVVAGRLVATREDGPGGRHVVGQIGPGETVGEMGLLSKQPRSASVRTSRDSVVVRITEKAFQRVVAAHPEVVSGAARLIIRRTTDLLRGRSATERSRTIAVVPLRAGARARDFVQRLGAALRRLGPTRIVDRASAAAVLSSGAGGEDGELALSSWLDEQELTNDSVVFAAERPDDAWTDRCVRQADVVVLLAPFDDAPECRADEVGIPPGEPDGPRRELVLLHEPGARPPEGTSRWLGARRVARHHHVRWDREGDFRRLARFLTGNAIGLVLGGGGARGFAHVGVLRALREARIPVDAVGGTSQGAIVAAMVAMDWDGAAIERVHREGFTRRNPIGDYALLPHVALVKGKRLMAALERAFGARDVEDTWKRFFCVSSNLALACPEVHTRGPICRALRASVSIPGILPPVIIGGHLHVDGALLDNLPVEPMRAMGVGRVIAVDVTAKNEPALSCAELPSTRAFLRERLVPGAARSTAPGLGTILVKSLLLSSMQRAREASAAADLALDPELTGIGLLEWTALDRGIALGYRHAKAELERRGVPAWADREPVES